MEKLILRGGWSVNFRNANLVTARFRKFHEEKLNGAGIQGKKSFQSLGIPRRGVIFSAT